MTATRKLLVTVAFILILIGLGTADALLTRGTLRLPSTEQEGIAKKLGPDAIAIASVQGFTVAATTEQNLLPKILSSTMQSQFAAKVLLMSDDRVATMGWIDSPDVQTLFMTLRKNLRSSFSPKLQDLIDETQSEKDKPPRDVLSFLDPAIHSDRLLFVRIRERLYEFHVSAGHEVDIDKLIDTLTE